MQHTRPHERRHGARGRTRIYKNVIEFNQRQNGWLLQSSLERNGHWAPCNVVPNPAVYMVDVHSAGDHPLSPGVNDAHPYFYLSKKAPDGTGILFDKSHRKYG